MRWLTARYSFVDRCINCGTSAPATSLPETPGAPLTRRSPSETPPPFGILFATFWRNLDRTEIYNHIIKNISVAAGSLVCLGPPTKNFDEPVRDEGCGLPRERRRHATEAKQPRLDPVLRRARIRPGRGTPRPLGYGRSMTLVSLAVCALRVLCSRKRVKLVHQYLDFILCGFADPIDEFTDLGMGRNMR